MQQHSHINVSAFEVGPFDTLCTEFLYFGFCISKQNSMSSCQHTFFFLTVFNFIYILLEFISIFSCFLLVFPLSTLSDYYSIHYRVFFIFLDDLIKKAVRITVFPFFLCFSFVLLLIALKESFTYDIIKDETPAGKLLLQTNI